MVREQPVKRVVVKGFFLLCLLLAPVCPGAQETSETRYDLQSCLNKALASHPASKSGQLLEEEARSALSVRKAERNPTITLGGESGHLSGRPTGPFAVVGGVTEEGVSADERRSGEFYNAQVKGSVSLFDDGAFFGQPSSTIREAEFGLDEAQWKNQGLRAQISEAVIEAYVRVLKDQDALATYEKIVSLSEKEHALYQAKFQQDLISKNDLLKAELQLERAKMDLSRSKLSLDRSKRNLALLIGANDSLDFSLDDLTVTPIQLPPCEEVAAFVLQNHPSVKAQEFRMKMKEEAVHKALNERYPTLSLKSNYGIGDDFEGKYDDEFIAAVEMEVPVFDFGLQKRTVELARIEALAEGNRLLEDKLKLEQQVQDLYYRILELGKEIEVTEKEIAQAGEELKLAQAKFEQDMEAQSAVHDAESALLGSQLALRNAMYDQRQAYLQLKLLYGKEDNASPE